MSTISEQYAEFALENRRADQHRGTPEDRLERHQRACRRIARFGRRAAAEISRHAYQRIRHEDSLFLAISYIAAQSGQTPGPDNERWPDDLGDPHAYARGLRDEIDDGEYDHDETLTKHISKGRGRGTRPIQLTNLCDRAVHRAIAQVIGPILDAGFDPNSFGGRPDRDRRHALVAAEQLGASGSLVWICEDLKDAFECVPQARLLQLLRKSLPVRPEQERKRRAFNRPIHEDLHSLLAKMLKTDSGTGVRQGAPSSSLMLNLYAHHLLDLPWRRLHPDRPLLRYVDDLLIPCQSVEEAQALRQDLVRMLHPTGMRLKQPQPGQSTIHDLCAGESAVWLGFRIGWRAGRLHTQPKLGAWQDQANKLAECAGLPRKDRRLGERLLSWIRQMGPAYPHTNRGRGYFTLFRAASKLGVRGLPKVPRARGGVEGSVRRLAGPASPERAGVAAGSRGDVLKAILAMVRRAIGCRMTDRGPRPPPGPSPSRWKRPPGAFGGLGAALGPGRLKIAPIGFWGRAVGCHRETLAS